MHLRALPQEMLKILILGINCEITKSKLQSYPPGAHGLTPKERNEMATILHTMFSDVSPWMKIIWFRLEFQSSLFLRVQLTKNQHWFRYWLGAEQATSHYLIQWSPDSLTHLCVTRPHWVNDDAGQSACFRSGRSSEFEVEWSDQ